LTTTRHDALAPRIDMSGIGKLDALDDSANPIPPVRSADARIAVNLTDRPVAN
jgi:hypothetical protein